MRRVLSGLSLLLFLAVMIPVAPAVADLPPDPTPTTIFVLLVADLDARVAGEPSDFTAVLGAEEPSGTVAVQGETLTLWAQPSGSASFTQVGHATTDASGQATVWAALDHSAVVRWTYAGNAPTYAASTPVDFGVEVAPRVTLRVHDRTLRRHQRLVVTGRTFPAKAGCTVTLWKGPRPAPLTVGPKPVRLAQSTVRLDGTYRLVHRFHHRARMRVRVTVMACAGNARGFSGSVGIRVR